MQVPATARQQAPSPAPATLPCAPGLFVKATLHPARASRDAAALSHKRRRTQVRRPALYRPGAKPQEPGQQKFRGPKARSIASQSDLNVCPNPAPPHRITIAKNGSSPGPNRFAQLPSNRPFTLPPAPCSPAAPVDPPQSPARQSASPAPISSGRAAQNKPTAPSAPPPRPQL